MASRTKKSRVKSAPKKAAKAPKTLPTIEAPDGLFRRYRPSRFEALYEQLQKEAHVDIPSEGKTPEEKREHLEGLIGELRRSLQNRVRNQLGKTLSIIRATDLSAIRVAFDVRHAGRGPQAYAEKRQEIVKAPKRAKAAPKPAAKKAKAPKRSKAAPKRALKKAKSAA